VLKLLKFGERRSWIAQLHDDLTRFRDVLAQWQPRLFQQVAARHAAMALLSQTSFGSQAFQLPITHRERLARVSA
jgi:hypothetical protein